ncbi:hemin ABC transporter substrate-binding protein [Cupriavidus pauculus]|uniref:heme/hemin ABC transporter substrate-binding protein n=1 Tax=Cupriavidus pauculus TaxID=82633 RepID=UPI001EE3245C|nr:hemin ABC transporter substrate-binding protein [Cupriavidus pauculus]GJG94444.1 hemin ABC transporter substrate-binding protein [Cupriavidus pauculus]
MKLLRVALSAVLCAAGIAHAAPPARVVGLGGPATEIVYALDAGKSMVGVDSSSIYPPAALKLPKVGYYRAFSVEGVASLKPDLVLALDHSGPPQALEQVRKLGSKVVVLPSEPTLAALDQRILGIAAALEMTAQGQALVDRLHAELRDIKPSAQPVRVLMVSSHTGKMQAVGEDTAGDAMLKLVGATNVMAGQQGFKPFSAEAAAALRPDVIVTTSMSVTASGSVDAFLAQPGLSATPAARGKRVVVMDDLLLLSFGPRLPEALRLLQNGLTGRRVATR